MDYVPRTWKEVYRELFETPDYLIEWEDYSQITETEFKKQALPQKRKVNIIDFEIKEMCFMPIYKVTMWVERKIEVEVEAKDECYAQDKAIEEADFNEDEMLQDRTEVVLSDSQYTDQQELQDEERRYEQKYG